MSEKLIMPEQREALPTPEKHEQLTAHAASEKSKKAEKDPRQSLHEARTAIEEIESTDNRPNPLDKLKAVENQSQLPTATHINQELKQITLRRELQHIRRKLSAPQRVLSKAIHQPVVRVVSEGAGKTVSRPSGLLGGGIVAFIGTSGYLYMAKHLGFRYNYLVFLLLFVGGFLLGLILELAIHLATSSRRKAHD